MPTDPNHANRSAPRGHRTARAALALVALAVLCVAYLHAVVPLSPVRKMVSDYAHTPVGGAVLPVGLLAFAAALVLLAHGLRTAGLAGRRVVGPLVTAAVGLVLIAACHGDAAGTGTTLRGLVHKAGGGLLFGALPFAGWALAGPCAARPAWRGAAAPLRRLSTLAAVLVVAFLLGYLPEFGVPVPGSWFASHTHGLLERAVLGVETVLVILAAGRLARSGRASSAPAVPALRPGHPARPDRPAARHADPGVVRRVVRAAGPVPGRSASGSPGPGQPVVGRAGAVPSALAVWRPEGGPAGAEGGPA